MYTIEMKKRDLSLEYKQHKQLTFFFFEADALPPTDEAEKKYEALSLLHFALYTHLEVSWRHPTPLSPSLLMLYP